MSRLNRITNDSGFIEKETFVNFAKRYKHFTNRPNDHKDDDRSEVIKEHVDQQRKTDRLDRAVLAFKVSVLVPKIIKILHVRTGD